MTNKIIKSFDEITEVDVKYHLTIGKWVKIDYFDSSQAEYMIYRKFYRHQLYNFETHGDYVRTWKTFSGALRFIKKNYAKHLGG